MTPKTPTISVIVNTCSLGAAATLRSSKGYGEAYAKRAALLRDRILPRLRDDSFVSEVIVVGEFEEGEGYVYVHAPGPDANVWDQCFQKDEGVKASSGDILVFLCDDHLPDATFFRRLLHHWSRNRLWDVLSPNRAVSGVGYVATGWDEDYVHAHAVVIKASALTRVTWRQVWEEVRGTWALDVPMTEFWRRQGLRVACDPDLLVWDIEDNTFEHGVRA